MSKERANTRTEIIRVLTEAVAVMPDFANARHWLGHQLMRSPSGFDEALPHLEAVTLSQLSDSHPLDTLMLIGQAYERRGELQSTASAFNRGVRLLHKMLEAKQNVEEKIRYRFALTHFQLGRTYMLMGEPHKAFEVATAAMRLFPSVYHVTDILALSLHHLGRMPEAIAQYVASCTHASAAAGCGAKGANGEASGVRFASSGRQPERVCSCRAAGPTDERYARRVCARNFVR